MYTNHCNHKYNKILTNEIKVVIMVNTIMPFVKHLKVGGK
jgi:hypothetical protein